MSEPWGREPREPWGDASGDTSGEADAGPALRVREDLLPGSEFTGRALHVEGPSEEPDGATHRRRATSDARFAGIAVGALLVAAAFAFWSSGVQRGDALLQSLAAVFIAFAIAAVLVGVYLARSD